MSRDLKYIGMDVDKEAVVIAVLNSSDKLVMESIVETRKRKGAAFCSSSTVCGASCM
jgi:hypothetical protein